MSEAAWLTEKVRSASWADGDLFGLTTRQAGRIAKAVSEELDARERHGFALGSGLSDAEARAEGWPDE